jgi:hypothetical protein
MKKNSDIQKIRAPQCFVPFLAFTCGWCGKPFSPSKGVHASSLDFPHLDWEGCEGHFIPLPVLDPGKPVVPAFVCPKDFELFGEKGSLVLLFCSLRCQTKFRERLCLLSKRIEKLEGLMSAFEMEEKKAEGQISDPRRNVEESGKGIEEGEGIH